MGIQLIYVAPDGAIYIPAGFARIKAHPHDTGETLCDVWTPDGELQKDQWLDKMPEGSIAIEASVPKTEVQARMIRALVLT